MKLLRNLGVLFPMALACACSTDPEETGTQDASTTPTPTPDGSQTPTPDASPMPTPTCGAGKAMKCKVDEGCAVDADCVTGNCDANVCKAASCSDKKRDGDEEGVDCGGTVCKRCDGAACSQDTQCTSEICFKNVCAPVGTKTCGVGFEQLCVDGKSCQTDTDCSSDVCEGAKCIAVTPAAHTDTRRNAGETGVDCGGSIKATKVCLAGQGCVDSTDCEAECDLATKKCGVSTRLDGRFSPSLGETDVDCGGTMADSLGNAAKKCLSTKKCKVGGDCDSGYCTNNVCEPRMAGRKDGDETDIDCGGTADPDTGTPAPRCEDGQSCAADADCAILCNTATSKCVSGRSCKQMATGAGLDTCGLRESNDAAKVHESCCRALPVPGTSIRAGKYEVTTGRMRQFIDTVGPNLRQWAQNEIANNSPAGQVLAAQIPATARAFLPASKLPGDALNLIIQLGAGTLDKRRPSMVQGCFNGVGAYGHATYWQPHADLQAAYGMSFPARRFTQAQYDEKPMNCSPYWMYAAFCAWDGGRLPTNAESIIMWGANTYPWGTTRYPTAGVTNYLTTVNWGNSVPATPVLFYHYPGYADQPAGVLADSVGYIAAPGRFPLDLTALRTPANANEGWMDLGANLMEMTATDGSGNASFCDYATRGTGEVLAPTSTCPLQDGAGAVLRQANGMAGSQWIGGSWEGHGSFNVNANPPFTRAWYAPFPLATQYGKTGFRCVYP